MKDTLVQARHGPGRPARRPRQGARAARRRRARARDDPSSQAARRGHQRPRDGRHRGEVRADARRARRRAAAAASPRRRRSCRSPNATSRRCRPSSRRSWRAPIRAAHAAVADAAADDGPRRTASALRDEIDSMGRARERRGPRGRRGAPARRAEAPDGEIVIVGGWRFSAPALLRVVGRRRAARRTRSSRSVQRAADRQHHRSFGRADGRRASARAVARRDRRARCIRRPSPMSSAAFCCSASATGATSCDARSPSVFCARSRSSPRRQSSSVPTPTETVTLDVRTTDEVALVLGGAVGRGSPPLRFFRVGRREPRRARASSLAADWRDGGHVSRRLRRPVHRQPVPRPAVHVHGRAATRIRSAATGRWTRRIAFYTDIQRIAWRAQAGAIDDYVAVSERRELEPRDPRRRETTSTSAASCASGRRDV